MAQMTVVPDVRASSASSAPSASALAPSSRAVGSSATIDAAGARRAPGQARRARAGPPRARRPGRSACSSSPTAASASAARLDASARATPRSASAELGVLAGAEEGDEPERLADERDRAPPQLRAAGAVERAERDAVDEHVALVREVEPGEQVQERRLAGAGRPRDGGELPGRERRVEPLERRRRAEPLRQPARLDGLC